MLRATIIQPDQPYTFADYFKLNFAPQDILAYFGVTLQRQTLSLEPYTGALDRLTDLKTRITESLPRLSLTNSKAPWTICCKTIKPFLSLKLKTRI